MAYDIASAFEDIELSLIKSMRNNMRHHISEEYDEGINWTQWQAEMLSGLSQYRAQNKDVLTGYMGRLNDEIDKAIREAYATGESEQEIELLKAIKRGYEAPKDGTNMQGRFFRNNQKKLNSLIKATTKDMKKAETALLRMSDDVYRQTLYKAQLFYNTGAGSMWQCIDMATRDFLNAGYNCVQYKNGSRVNIASYAEMALRTANKRANLMGQADFRERYGVHTVKVNARGTACPRCLPFLGQVFIDDVYGGGTYEESTQTGYPLLSSAVNSGLFHPNCKDACSSYYEGISREPKTISKEQEEETLRRYNLEQEQRYYERNYRRNMRLAKGCMDSDTADKYYGKANICKNKLIELCDNNSDVLRLDKARISLRGVLSVDNVGKISDILEKPYDKSTDYAYNKLIDRLNSAKVEYNPVKYLKSKPTESEIIKAIAGGDQTDGSCASLGIAYMGRTYGYDVLDFRDGNSRSVFSSTLQLDNFSRMQGITAIREKGACSLTVGNRLLKKVEEGKEYYLCVGRHASIVRKKDGILQYLELQNELDASYHPAGWIDFNKDPKYTLSNRFGCTTTSKYYYSDMDFMIDISESDFNTQEFKSILGYINTDADKQVKGDKGYAK